MTTTLEHRARAMSRLVDEARDKIDRAFRLANSAYEDQASDLLMLVRDAGEWAEDLGPDAEAWAAKVAKQADLATRLIDSARGSLMLAHVQLGMTVDDRHVAEAVLTDEINRHPA